MAAFPEAWRSTGRGNGYELVVRVICEPGKGLVEVNGWPGPPSRPIAAMARLKLANFSNLICKSAHGDEGGQVAAQWIYF
jgi:hypothetical protein